LADHHGESRLAGYYHRHSYQITACLLAGLVTAVFFVLFFCVTDWHPYLIWILAVSITTFGMIGLDKGLAKTEFPRIPESTLHIFTVLGGAPGQWLGRTIFHHKVNFAGNPNFRTVLWIGLIIHSILIFSVFFPRN
jgi:uncharacterized membrane protein YsdA (DUF1294 family)